MCRLCGEAQPRILTARLMVSLPVHVSCFDLFIVYTNMSGVTQPLSWATLKQRLIARFASAFSTQQVWHYLAFLQRGKDINEYHQRFGELIHLVGETPSSVLPGSQAFNIYEKKMDPVARHIWSAIAVQGKFANQTLSLHHIMMVAGEEFVKTTMGLPSVSISQGGVVTASPQPTALVAVPGAGRATTTTPGPMELGIMGSCTSDRCARCRGMGHWAHQYPTLQGWKEGDPVVMPPRRGGRGRGSGSGRRGRGGSGRGRSANSMEAEKEPGVGGSSSSGGRVEEIEKDSSSDEEVGSA